MANLTVVVLIIVIAVVFDFTNGFHDAANAIATSVSTRALRPQWALLLSAVLNLAGAYFLTGKVAATVGKGVIKPEAVTLAIVGAALLGAIAWNLITWRLGLPSSSTHALIGGLIGSMLMAHGTSFVLWNSILVKTIEPGILSPLIGVVIGFLVMLALYWIFRAWRPTMVNAVFRRLQILSAAFVSFSHGANDAQKTMGVITLALVAGGYQKAFHIPVWVIVLCSVTIAAGTFSGGWRIIRTMGQRIIRLQPINGFAVETSAAAILLFTSFKGFPVSTTHVISGSIMGVGATRNPSLVRWGVAGNILVAWVLTIPGAALIAGIVYGVVHLVGAK